MKNQELRSSLIKSAIILILSIFFIYAFASGDSGGISGTIGSIFSAVVFLIGLTLALIVSVAVLFGIYFATLYYYKPETCSSTYAEMKAKIGELSESMGCRCCCAPTPLTSSGNTTSATTVTEERNKRPDALENQITETLQILSILQGQLDASGSATKEAGVQIVTIETRLSSIEDDLANRPTSETMDAAANQVSGELEKFQKSLSTMQGSISGIESGLAALKNSAEEDTEDTQHQKMDTAVTDIREELSTLRTAIASLNDASSTAASRKEETADKDSEHRILSYFVTKDDAEQFTSKVVAAVDKGMTYAEIGEFLDDSLSVEACDVIADHPSLTKDYIRTCRQSS